VKKKNDAMAHAIASFFVKLYHFKIEELKD
jgi:hypothetical protein